VVLLIEEQVYLAMIVCGGNRCWWPDGLSSVVAFGKQPVLLVVYNGEKERP